MDKGITLLLIALVINTAAAVDSSCKCVDGLSGRDGRDGMPGRDGKDCDIKTGAGGVGPQGPAGPPGPNGINGSPGTPGPSGAHGDRGSEGARGDRGTPGRDGSDAGVLRSEVERMVREMMSATAGSTDVTSVPGGAAVPLPPGKLKRVSVCASLSKTICGRCQCRDKDYADEFFSRGHYCDCQNIPAERDCKKHRQNGAQHDGIYLIKPGDVYPFPVKCDMATENGGWVVFQKRIDDTVSFQRDWHSYKYGFGNLQHEFWLGLENIFLVQLWDDRRGTELRIDFKDKEGNVYHEQYGVFELKDESTKYKIHLEGYSGNALNIMKNYNDKKFCTFDDDNDEYGGNGALAYGAFWYGAASSYPYQANYPYAYVAVQSVKYDQKNIKAFKMTAKGATKDIVEIEMKIRRK